MAASLIERLPDEGDPQRSREERVAKNVVFVAYAGTWFVNNQAWSDFFIPTRPVSAGSDTVSKGIKDVISLIALAQ